MLRHITATPAGLDFFEAILWYNINKVDASNKQLLEATMENIVEKHKTKQVLGSLVQSWFDEGELKGKLEGKAEGKAEKEREIAKNLLQLGLKFEDIAKATGLSLKDLEQLKTKLNS